MSAKPLWADLDVADVTPSPTPSPARIVSPVPGYGITTPWGKKPKDHTYWQARGHHTGDDYADADGSGRVAGHLVVAVLAGHALYRGFDTVLGRVVLLEADDGNTYWYCHLNTVAVPTTLERVEAGQVLGRVGQSGTGAQGPHLHFEKRSGHSRSWAGTDLLPRW